MHAATLNEDSYQRIAATGGTVSVATESEQTCGQGYPPTWTLRNYDIPVALSMDTSVWWSADIFSAMRSTIGADRAREHLEAHAKGDTVTNCSLRADQVVEWATIGGAKALGLDAVVGSLEVGKKADVVLIKNDHSPVMFPMLHPYGHVVFQAQRGDVHTVVVNGRVVKHDHRLVDIDLDRTRRAVESTVEYLQSQLGDQWEQEHAPGDPRLQGARQPVHLHRLPQRRDPRRLTTKDGDSHASCCPRIVTWPRWAGRYQLGPVQGDAMATDTSRSDLPATPTATARRPWSLWVGTGLLAAMGLLLAAVGVFGEDARPAMAVVGLAVVVAAVLPLFAPVVGWWLAAVTCAVLVALDLIGFSAGANSGLVIALCWLVLAGTFLLLARPSTGGGGAAGAVAVNGLERPEGWTKEWAGGWFKLVAMSLFGTLCLLVGSVMTAASFSDDPDAPAAGMPVLTLAFGIALLSTVPMFWPRRTARPALRDVSALDAGIGVAFPYSAARRHGALLCSLAFVACGLAMAAFDTGLVMRVAGGVAVLFFGFFGWYQLRRRARSWALVATPTGVGVIDGPGEVFVPWDAVQDIRADETTTYTRGGATHEPHIAVFTEPDAVQHDDAVDSRLAELGQKWTGADVSWTVRALAVDPVVVISALRHYLRHPDQRVELGDRRALDRIERGGPSAGLADAADDQGVHGHRARGPGDQRVDVQLAQVVAQLDRDRGHGDDRGPYGGEVARRPAADPVEQRPDPQPVEQPAGPRVVERRQGDRAVGEDLDEYAARRQHDDRAEQRVVRHPHRELDAGGRGRAHQHPRAEPVRQVVVARGDGRRIVQPEQHAAHVGLVRSGLAGLEDDREAEPLRRRERLVPGRDRGRLDRGDPVVPQQGERLDRVQRPGREPGAPTLPAVGVDGPGESGGPRLGKRHQVTRGRAARCASPRAPGRRRSAGGRPSPGRRRWSGW